MRKNLQREYEFKGVFGFTPPIAMDLKKVEKTLYRESLDDCEEYLKRNRPMEYLKYVQSKEPPKVGDLVITLRAGNYGNGRVLRVCKANNNFYILGNTGPVVHSRYAVKTNEWLDSFMVVNNLVKSKYKNGLVAVD